jgi:hypothetical protein
MPYPIRTIAGKKWIALSGYHLKIDAEKEVNSYKKHGEKSKIIEQDNYYKYIIYHPQLQREDIVIKCKKCGKVYPSYKEHKCK